MSGTNRKIKISLLLLATLMTTSFAFANSYRNNVVDVNVNKESSNAVKVTIYTDKPYTEPVVVNKKANNKYVILMPETKSNLKSVPSLTNVSGTVSGITVNTQEVSGGKGYTKIIITADKAINVVPRTQQLATPKPASTTIAKKDTASASVKQTQTAKTSEKPKTVTKQAPAKQSTTAVKKQAETTNKIVSTTTKPVAKQTPKTNQKSISNSVKKNVAQTDKYKTPVTKPVEPIKVLEKEINTNKTANNIIDDKNDSVLNREIKENELKNKEQVVNDNIQTDEKPKYEFNVFKGMSIWKLLLLAGAITFPILVILLILGMDKRINKQIDKSFKSKDPYYEPTNEDVIEQDNNQYSDTKSQTVVQSKLSHMYHSFDDMLNKVEEPDLAYQEEQYQYKDTENVQEVEFENDYEDTDFEHDFSQEVDNANIEVAQTIEEITNKDVVLPLEDIEPQEDFEIDNTENAEKLSEPKLESEPELKIETQKIENVSDNYMLTENPTEQVQEESYNPDGYLSEFADIDDNDFFDELTLQSMAQNNIDGLPEQLPADEIFDFMTEDIDEIIAESNEPGNEEPEYAQSIVDEAPEQESTSYDDLTMLTEVKLKDNTGLYLVNYDNFSSLVGHINDDYYVIKKFDDIVNDKIFLKETEKLKDATRYLVRVGKNKMVVEVSDKSMSRLLDL